MADVHVSSPAHSTSSPTHQTHNDDDEENEAGPSSYRPSLAELSRNASVISSTSSESEFEPPERPPRSAQAPSTLRLGPAGSSTNSAQATRSTSPAPASQSQLPAEPPTPRAKRAPGSTTNPDDLQLRAAAEPGSPVRSRAPSRQRGQRSSSANGTRGVSAQDFAFGDVLGEGSYSTVTQATHRSTGVVYAVKVLDKAHLKRNNKMQVAMAEKNVLVRLGAGHPGIVRLHYAFQDDWSLYFVLDLASNGELQTLISRLGSLSLPCVRWWTAQIIDALAYMHGKGVIHRDLKPENILLDSNWRVKLTDFGTGKIMVPGEVPARTFVGTAQYVAPELLERSETSAASDLWALGCVVFQAIAGRFAFVGLSEYLTWQKIKALEYTFPEGFDKAAGDLVAALFVRDPDARLGADNMDNLRAHPFFDGINWETLWTEEHPVIEAGLVKKEQKTPTSADDNFGHYFAWDGDEDGDEEDEWDEEDLDDGLSDDQRLRASVGNALRRPDDEMEWAPDARGSIPGLRMADQGVGEVGYGYAGGGEERDSPPLSRPTDEGGTASPADKGGTGTDPSNNNGVRNTPGRKLSFEPGFTFIPPAFPRTRTNSGGDLAHGQPFRFPRIEESAVDDADADSPIASAAAGGVNPSLVPSSAGSEPQRSPMGDGLGPLPSEAPGAALPVPTDPHGTRGGSFGATSAISASSSNSGSATLSTGGQSANGANGMDNDGPPATLVSGSPVERFGAKLMALGMHARRAASREGAPKEHRRGRSPGPATSGTIQDPGATAARPLSAAQSNSGSSDEPSGENINVVTSDAAGARQRTTSSSDAAVAGAINGLLQQGERVLHRGPVGARGLRRRKSVLRLTPSAKSGGEDVKPRTLVLTTRRLLVLKVYEGAAGEKKGAVVGVKTEMYLAGTAGAREKGRTVASGVDSRGELGFAVIAGDKPPMFIAANSGAAQEWMAKVVEAIGLVKKV